MGFTNLSLGSEVYYVNSDPGKKEVDGKDYNFFFLETLLTFFQVELLFAPTM